MKPWSPWKSTMAEQVHTRTHGDAKSCVEMDFLDHARITKSSEDRMMRRAESFMQSAIKPTNCLLRPSCWICSCLATSSTEQVVRQEPISLLAINDAQQRHRYQSFSYFGSALFLHRPDCDSGWRGRGWFLQASELYWPKTKGNFQKARTLWCLDATPKASVCNSCTHGIH